MITKCGTDIIEVERIKKSIEELGDTFLNRIYTKKEIEYCESKKIQKYQSYAARFAGKEAVLKAISNNLKVDNKYLIAFNEIEIVNNTNGRPFVNLLNDKIFGINSIDISLSHIKDYAIANVVVSIDE